MYGAGSYLLSRVIIELPQFIIFPLVFGAIAFPLAGLNVSSVCISSRSAALPWTHHQNFRLLLFSTNIVD